MINTCKTSILLIISLWILFPVMALAEKTVMLQSPSKNLKVNIRSVPEGLQLILSGPQKLNLTINAYGFVFEKNIFSSGFKINGIKQRTVNASWRTVYGERNLIPDRYQETEITLADKINPKEKMEIICRLYDEGIAFRYRFPGQQGQGLNISKELTSFSFEGNYEAWASVMAQSKIEKTNIGQINTVVERPLTIKQGELSYLALGEAALVDFARMKFLSDPEKSNVLLAKLDGNVDLEQAKFISPWRYIMVADSPGKLVENNYFVLNLNEPNQIKNTSWIKPGKVIREVTLTTPGGMACVDFAASHQIQYVEFDAGWYGPENNPKSDASGVHVDPARSAGPLDLQKIIDYANSKNVGIILYVNHNAMEYQLDEILSLYHSWGVKGVKYGFVNVGSQKWTSWLHEAVRKAAQNQLMVDIHDEYRPTGYSRTYPNLLTQEGIRGDEESPSIEHSLNTFFTRSIAGAGDNTNCYFAARVSEKMGGKTGQMAKAIILYSPWQFIYWYDRPEASPHKAGGAGGNESVIRESSELDFYKALPTVWDDTKVIDGEIGQYATIARRSGNDWFIGSLTAIEARDVKILLSFLDGKNSYQALLYYQDENGLKANKVSYIAMDVDSKSVISQKLPANSGLAIIIRKK